MTGAGPRPALYRVPGRLAVHRLPPDAAVPSLPSGPLVSVTRTPEELSIVCPEGAALAGARTESGWACFRVAGPLDFALTGVVAALSRALADAGIPIFVVSTYDTDWILTPETRATAAAEAWRRAGHAVDGA